MKNQFRTKIILAVLISLFPLDVLHSKSLDELLELSLGELTQLQVIPKKCSPEKGKDEQVYDNNNTKDSLQLPPTCLLMDSCSNEIPFTSSSEQIFSGSSTKIFRQGVIPETNFPTNFKCVNYVPSLALKNPRLTFFITIGTIFVNEHL